MRRGKEGARRDLSDKEILSESQTGVSNETDTGEKQSDEILSGQGLSIASHNRGKGKCNVSQRKGECLR